MGGSWRVGFALLSAFVSGQYLLRRDEVIDPGFSAVLSRCTRQPFRATAVGADREHRMTAEQERGVQQLVCLSFVSFGGTGRCMCFT